MPKRTSRPPLPPDFPRAFEWMATNTYELGGHHTAHGKLTEAGRRDGIAAARGHLERSADTRPGVYRVYLYDLTQRRRAGMWRIRVEGRNGVYARRARATAAAA